MYSMRKDSFFFSGRVAVNIICYIIHHPTGVGKSDFKHSELFYRHGLNACFYYFITVTSDSSFIRILINADFQWVFLLLWNSSLIAIQDKINKK